ncbi:MAG: class I tRNA ligase family protein, partial [Thermoplasmata archaeon]|nr:class I tRNA ligase family protein [Thermoplasmata archaeon]
MPLALHDSLTGQRHRVVPASPRGLTLYVCGPTVYAPAHVGHGRTYLYFDLLRRVLADRSVPVRHAMNITDVEDKISARAASLGVTWCQLARREERRFLADLRALRILRPTAIPRASDYVARMVEVARRLERRGRVRRSSEGWIYEPPAENALRNFPAGASLEDHAVPEPGHPFTGGPGDSREFLVWKPQAAPLPSFPSPWGRGVPGWHLECYTMARDLLGVPVDVHGGGMDLVFPHHYAENEVALSLDDSPFARTFLHTAFVTGNGTKMSKSTGNLVGLRTTLDAVGPDALRWYLLQLPYSRVLEWEDSALTAAADEHARVRRALAESLRAGAGGTLGLRAYERLAGDIEKALSDGLRAHDALAELREFVAALERNGSGRIARGDRAAA